jgi:hypothetical protein
MIIVIANNGDPTSGRSNVREMDSDFVRLSKQGGHEGKVLPV